MVVAVLAVLAGLLLPGLARARRAAGGARCTSNLHQFGIALQLYWDDHAGRAFPERMAYTNGGWTYWFGWLQDGVEGQRGFDPSAGALWPYIHGRGIETCPALDRANPAFKTKASGSAFGYAYNQLFGPRDRAPLNVGQLAGPSGSAVLADAAQVNDFQPPASPEHPMLEEFYYFGTNRMEATVHFRHDARAQVSYADGHVAAERPESGSLDDRIPGQLVGRLAADRVVPR